VHLPFKQSGVDVSGQSAFVRQLTQSSKDESQMGASVGQALPLAHDAAQRCSVGSQRSGAEQSASFKQLTQACCPGEQKGLVARQSLLFMHWTHIPNPCSQMGLAGVQSSGVMQVTAPELCPPQPALALHSLPAPAWLGSGALPASLAAGTITSPGASPQAIAMWIAAAGQSHERRGIMYFALPETALIRSQVLPAPSAAPNWR